MGEIVEDHFELISAVTDMYGNGTNFPMFQSLTQASSITASYSDNSEPQNENFNNPLPSLQSCDYMYLSMWGADCNITFPDLDYMHELYISTGEGAYNVSLPILRQANKLTFVFEGLPFSSLICDSLEYVGDGGLYLVDVDSLAFLSLDSIAGQLQIYNSNHSDLSFIENLSFLNSAEFVGNANLSACAIQAVCDKLELNPEAITVSNNAPGCSSIEEIQTQCLGSYASGTVYYDVDCDQQFNNDDALVSYPILLQGDTLPIGSSGGTGYFFVPLELNSTVSLYAQHTADWSTTGPVIITTDSTLQVMDDIHIGLCPVNILHDVSVHLNASMQPRPGFTVRYNLLAQNEWPGSDSVSVTFDIAQMPGASITGYAAGGTQQEATVSFATDLLYGQSQALWVDVLVPVGTPLGTAYTAAASIALADGNMEDNHPENNNYTLAQTVIGSYDPNDKLVTPAVIDLLDIDSTQTATIEYTIRFQNTGTAEAFFVRVLDTLSQALNPATFELIATSHPSEITFHDNHTIEWFFDNIMLPDSFSNEPGSHGFIQFRIQTLPLSEPFALENAAAIYFDFNEPVITPPAVTAVVICAEAGDACDDSDACTIGDVTQTDCSCSGTFADNDNDGICNAEDACDSTLAGSACDDLDPCTINDQIQSDCSCSGFFADSDSDGICDTSEIAGCTDMEACNYDANATDDDGSCSYVDLFAIVGNTNVTAGITEEYTYPGQPSSSFEWIVTPGTITAGQGTSIVSVVWDDAPNGTLQVTETNETNCAGEPVVLQANITPNSITAIGLSSIRLYPNPAHDQLFVSGNIPASTKMSLFNSIGQCVETGSFHNSIDVRGLAEGMYYLRLELDGTSIRKAFTIIDQ